jgi:DNA-binding winged helix-turn-helix (wHTH) protein
MRLQSLRLGSLTLDLERLRLEAQDGPAALRPKSFDVLRYLVEHAGRVVTKEELIGAIWPGLTVSDESLTQCISEVRRVIGDADKQLIKTIPRRGYMVEPQAPTVDNGRHGIHRLGLSGGPAPMPGHTPRDAPSDLVEMPKVTPTRVERDEPPLTGTVRRTFGTVFARSKIPATVAVMGVALAAGTVGATIRWSSRTLDGALHGTILCEKLPFTDMPMVAPMRLKLSGNSAAYSRDVLGPDHIAVIGIEEGTGTVTSDGAIKLIGEWVLGPSMGYTASYSGTVGDRTAELRGTQNWKIEGLNHIRNCMIKLLR